MENFDLVSFIEQKNLDDLSLKELGLLTFIAHHYPEDVTFDQIVSRVKDGKTAIYAAIDNLMQSGHITRERLFISGRAAGTVYRLNVPNS